MFKDSLYASKFKWISNKEKEIVRYRGLKIVLQKQQLVFWYMESTMGKCRERDAVRILTHGFDLQKKKEITEEGRD